jgi:hypothetical protein
MITSPKYKFVFIAPEKTGTTSIHDVLENIEDDKKIVGEIVPKDHNNYLYSKHTSCSEFQDNHFEFIDYFKFAFVRNPWDRVVSWYNFSMYLSNLENVEKERNISGKDFLSYIKEFQNIWGNEQQNQYEFTKCCDFIGRYENLQNDFNMICDKIGIPQQKLPHKNKTKHKCYTEYYDDETREVVAKKFAKDIEYFGYEFGE